MSKRTLQTLVTAWIILGLLGPLKAADRPASPKPPTISVDAEGKVAATPDMATLTLDVETQAPQAATASQKNARLAEGLLQAVKKLLGPEEKIRTLSYRLFPVYAPQDKAHPPEIKGYRASHRFQVQVRDLGRPGEVIDTAMKNGASRINGPYWGHSRLEELQREAAVDALGRARRLAEALAQAAGLKIKGVENISTGVRIVPWRGAREYALAAAPGGAPTPIEVGEEEIKANVHAVFQVSPGGG
jgi:uncharacterized protein YggE